MWKDAVQDFLTNVAPTILTRLGEGGAEVRPAASATRAKAPHDSAPQAESLPRLFPTEAPQAERTLRWIRNNIQDASQADSERIMEALSDANVNVLTEFGEVFRFRLEGQEKPWYRAEHKNWNPGEEITWDEEKAIETARFVGVLATTTLGAIGIFRDKVFKPGEYGNAIDGRLVQDPTTFKEVVDKVVLKSMGSKRTRVM